MIRKTSIAMFCGEIFVLQELSTLNPTPVMVTHLKELIIRVRFDKKGKKNHGFENLELVVVAFFFYLFFMYVLAQSRDGIPHSRGLISRTSCTNSTAF